MRLTVTLLLIFVLKGFAVKAQLKISSNGTLLSPEQLGLRYVMRDGIHISREELARIAPEEWQALHQLQPLPLKSTEQTLWISIRLKEIPADNVWLLVKDPHVNELSVWLRKGDSIRHEFNKTGDHFPFKSRIIPANDFVFPLPRSHSDSLELIIAADKRHTKTLLPLYFLSDEQFSGSTKNKALTHGILLGLTLIIFIYNAALWLLIRQKMFFWYSLYLLLILLYFLSDMGYLFEYVHPNLPSVNDVLRVGIIAGSIIPFILFFNSLLELKIRHPLFCRINRVILLLFAIIYCTGLAAAAMGNFRQQLFWINTYSILSPSILVVLTAESLYCALHKIPFAKYTTCSLLCFVGMSAVFIGHERGLLPDHFITENALYLGISIEIFIITMAIAARFNSFRKTSETLLREKNSRQEEMLKTVSAYQEQEMQRFSSMLHDTVGAKLSAIRMNLDVLGADPVENIRTDKIQELATEVSALADEVRTFSHERSPLLLQKNGLVSAIRQYINSINRTGNIRIQFESIGALQSVSFAQEILLYSILQELIHNMIRHAQADSGIIQLLLDTAIISVNVEDDGKGFDPGKIQEGLGFTQIRKLVAFVDGNFALTTSPGNGCRISIEFKNTDHAENA